MGPRLGPHRRRDRHPAAGAGRQFAPPTLETVVVPARPGERGALHAALTQLAEQDPLIDLRQDDLQGVHGWRTTDCVVTLTHSGYWARQSHAHGTFDKSMSSTAGDFRNLTPLVLMDALRAAGTTVLEPIHRFRLEFPADALGAVLPALAQAQAVPLRNLTGLVEGEVPAASVAALQRQLPGLTRGEGVLTVDFDRYAPVRGPAPSRPRTDDNRTGAAIALRRTSSEVVMPADSPAPVPWTSGSHPRTNPGTDP